MARLYFTLPSNAAHDRGPDLALPMIELDVEAPEASDAPKPKTRLTTPSWSPAMAAKSSA